MLGVRSSLVDLRGSRGGSAFLAFSHALCFSPDRRRCRGTRSSSRAPSGRVVLGDWIVRHGRMTSDQHQRGMYRALAAWALTDIAVVVAFAV